MSDDARRAIIALFMVFVFILMFAAPMEVTEKALDLKNYYATNYIKDTASQNAVTGIYLNYRIFDTLFETLLLLTSVIGIIYFSRHEGDS